MVKRNYTNTVIPELQDDEFDALQNWAPNPALLEELETQLGIKLSTFDRRQIRWTLAIYASAAFEAKERDLLSHKSELAVVDALDRLFSVLDEQRCYPVPDPRRTGLEYFVEYSQRGYTAADSDQRTRAILSGRDPGPPGLCRDTFEQFQAERGGSYHSLGERQGWLEILLREIRDRLGRKPQHQKKRGPKGKARYRTFVIFGFAEVFERSGGKLKAYKNPNTGKIEGDFINFVAAILKTCPPTFRNYLGTGIDDAIVKWVQSGRKAPFEGIVRIPLF